MTARKSDQELAMGDDEDILLPAGDEESLALIHAYDFLKHITTLSLISIGGVLGLVQGNDLGIKPIAFIIIMGLIGAGGALALLTNASLIGHRLLKRPRKKDISKSFATLQALSTGLFLMGIGAFVGAFTRVLQ